MKLIKKMTNRYNILRLILVILMSALIFRLATLTIVEGDDYRDKSDNKRLKEVSTTAARGEIRDRYGRLLAGNKPSFTVQILKDELNMKSNEEKNDSLLSLIRLLEEDGVSYVDEFPIDLNIFKYRDEDDYKKEEVTPIYKVIDIINEENILKDIILTFYNHPDYDEHYQFATSERAVHALRSKGFDIPITIIKNGTGVELEFDKNKNINKWKSDNDIPEHLDPVDTLIRLIDGDKTIIRKIIDHPISRKLVYEILTSKNIASNIVMSEYSLSYDDEYRSQKRTLVDTYSSVTEESSAKEDFINIFLEESINSLLERVVVKTNSKGKEEIIIPGQILLDILLEEDENIPITLELNDEKTTVIYKYMGNDNVGDKKPVDILIEYGESMGLLDEFISDETIRPLAQEELLNHGINTRISIAEDFEYVAINNKIKWFGENGIDEDSTIEEAFEYLKKKRNIPNWLSNYETRSVLLLYEELSKQGYMAYQPLNIAYDIKNSTVAKIEEGMSELTGIQVSIEPVRFYPEGETAAHILGYLGKIGLQSEINKYVLEKGYSPNDIIGKTGVEESHEDILRGKNGVKWVEVDAFGNTTAVLKEEKPIPGDNLYLTIDMELQKVTEAALKKTLEKIRTGGTYESEWGNYKMGIDRRKNRPYRNATSGATVVIDVKNMEVLSMASYPAYDPNLFSTGISDTDWQSLFPENEKDLLAPRPLYNVATQTAVQPGSVFKMVTGLAGLEKGISPTKKIRDMGYVKIGDTEPACWIWNQSRSTHGYENLYEAIRDSCNYYMYSLALGKNQRTGEDIGVKVEIEDIIDLSKQLGLNDKTGIEINIPTETSGGVPEPHKKIIARKNMLGNYLKREIEKYINEDVKLTEEEIKEVIEEIVSWLELDEILTRGEVIRRLTELGIDPERVLPGQSAGMADIIKYDYLNQAGWSISDTLNITIGQGESSYTPIQMANSLAIMVNGGYKRRLSLVDNIKSYNNSKTTYENKEELERIKLNNYNNLEDIKKGMLLTSTEGTSSSVFSKFPIPTGTKTGTAQHTGINPVTGEKYDDFAWFVGFAPYDDPEIAIATIIFQGGSGGYAAPMTRDIIAEYLGLNAVDTKETLPFNNKLTE